MNVFFFGGSSFAAQYLSKELNKEKQKNFNIYFFSRKKNKHSNTYFFDLKNKKHKCFKKIHVKKVDYLFFFSSFVPLDETKADWTKCNSINVTGLISLINDLKIPIKKIILASSASLYGKNININYNEQSFLKPENAYSMSKFLQEKILHIYCNNKNIDFLSYRLGYVFGDKMSNQRLVKKIYLKYKKNEKVKLYNKNLNLNLIHTKDISLIIKKTFISSKGIYNLNYLHKITLLEFYNFLIKKKQNFIKIKNNFSSKKIFRIFSENNKIDPVKSIQHFKNEN